MPVTKGELSKAVRVVRGDPSLTQGNDTNGLPYNIEFDRIYYGEDLKFDKWSSGYFWIKNTGTNTLTFMTTSASSGGNAGQFSDATATPVMYYAIPGEVSTETPLQVVGTSNSINIAPGKRICLINRNTNTNAGFSYDESNYIILGLTGNTTVEIGGSWGALAPCLKNHGYISSYCFYRLFGNGGLSDATTKVSILSSPTDCDFDVECYPHAFDHAFDGAVALRAFQDMEFLHVAAYAFSYMFNGCTNLGNSDTAAAHVPDITFVGGNASHLFEYAFYGCTSIVTGPRVCCIDGNMVNYAEYAYADTFRGCTAMTSLKEQYISNWWIGDHAFHETFYGCTQLVHPMGFRNGIRRAALCVDNYGFSYTFYGCTALRTVPNAIFENYESPDPNNISLDMRSCPEFVAVGDTGYSFQYMFYGCTALTSASYAPSGSNYQDAIPAAGAIRLSSHDRTASSHAFWYMFWGCTALTDMSSLWANGSNFCNKDYSCQRMFYNCTALVKGACPSDTESSQYCWSYMFYGCTSLKSVKGFNLQNTATYCCRSMFYNCTSLEVSPYLTPATLSGTGPYYYMFGACTNLKCIVTNQNETGNRTNYWTWGIGGHSGSCSNETGVFVKTNSAFTSTTRNSSANQHATSGASGAKYIPHTWTIVTNPLLFKSDSSFSVKLTKTGSPTTLATLDYINVGAGTSGDYLSLVNGSWGSGSTTGRLTSSSGAPIIFYNGTTSGAAFSTSESDYYQFFIPTGANVECIGNLNSLCTAVSGTLSSTFSYKFYKLFADCTRLSRMSSVVSVGALATNRGYNFKYMFQGCTSLTEAPAILATDAGKEDYAFMFNGCTALTAGPSLSGFTSMSQGSFQGMFYDCTSLASTVSLPASSVSLKSQCFMWLYYNCKALTAIPENYLPWTTLASQCYAAMFDTCDNLVDVPSNLLPATSLSEACYANMFQNCYSLIDAPALPATSMTAQCYQYMFRGCTSLTSITVGFSAWANSWGDARYRTTLGWTENVGPEGHFNCPSGLPVYMNDAGNGSNSVQNTGSTDTSACYIPYNWTHTSSNTPVDPKIFRFERASGTVTITANSVINYGNGMEVSTNGTTWTPQSGKTANSPWTFTIDQDHPRVCLRYSHHDDDGLPRISSTVEDSFVSYESAWFTVTGNGTINATGNLGVFTLLTNAGTEYSVAGIFKNISQLKDCSGIYFGNDMYDVHFPRYLSSMFYNSGVTKVMKSLLRPLNVIAANLAFANCSSLTDGCDLVTKNMFSHDGTWYGGYSASLIGYVREFSFYSIYLNCTNLKSTSSSPIIVGTYNFNNPSAAQSHENYHFFNFIENKAFKMAFKGCSGSNFNRIVINFNYLGLKWANAISVESTGDPLYSFNHQYSKRTFEEAFSGCSNLNEIYVRMRRWPANYCTNNWVVGVANSGDFYAIDYGQHAGLQHGKPLTTFPPGIDKVPSGWDHEYIRDIFWPE